MLLAAYFIDFYFYFFLQQLLLYNSVFALIALQSMFFPLESKLLSLTLAQNLA